MKRIPMSAHRRRRLTLLLRRVMLAFGVSPGDVRVVATSATIGEGEEAEKKKLRRFIADLAGISENQVNVIFGHRQLPAYPSAETKEFPTLEMLKSMSDSDRYAFLSKNEVAQNLVQMLAQKPRLISEMEGLIRSSKNETLYELLSKLDLCASANDNREFFLTHQSSFVP